MRRVTRRSTLFLSGLLAILLNPFAVYPQERSASTLPTEFNRLAEAYYEEVLKLNPLQASAIGDNRYNDRLAIDIGKDYRKEEKAIAEKYRAALNRLSPAGLSDDDRISFQMLKAELDDTLEAEKFPSYLIPISQSFGMPLDFAQLGSGGSYHPFKTVKDYDDFLLRANFFVQWVDVAIANMNEGIKRGIVQPKTIIEATLPQLESLSNPNPNASIFYQPIKNMPAEFSPADKARLESSYRRAIAEKIAPVYEKLHVYLRDTYLAKCRNTISLRQLPNGERWYQYWVKHYTTTNLTPQEIFDLGMAEVQRIRKEMEQTIAEIGFRGTIEEFMQSLSRDPRNQIKREEIFSDYQRIRKTVDTNLPKLFLKTPDVPFEIRPVEEFQAKTTPLGFYSPAAPNGERPGIFYVNVYWPNFPRYLMEYLFLHEAIPGHHFDRSIAQQQTNLPRFRRFGLIGAYTEGWGLYSESLGKELGLYHDPYQYFGRLVGDIGRASRLVGDVGIHYKGWTKEQATEFLKKNTIEFIVGEIDRFTAIPGQGLAYKVGQLKILQLRAKAQQELGAKFDIREFHDQILKDGAVPLDVLERKIDKWIESKK